MKKILLMISCCLFALTSCEIDNYESPNASIHGSIIDEKTGELVGMDVQDGGELKVVELGFANPQTQSWKITRICTPLSKRTTSMATMP